MYVYVCVCNVKNCGVNFLPQLQWRDMQVHV
jgi:hypothetical protein